MLYGCLECTLWVRIYIYIYMLYILYILHLQSFTYTYSFILYVDIAGLHVDLHKSICMYVNMHYALVYTNLYPICFVLHFIHIDIHIYIYIELYIHVVKTRMCTTHTRVHVRWCLKQNCYSSPSSWSLLTSAFLSTFFCAPSRSSPRCLSPTTRSRRSGWKCWSLNTCRSGKNHYVDDSFLPRLDLRNQSSFTRLQFGRKFVYLIIPIFMTCICIRILYIYVIFVHI